MWATCGPAGGRTFLSTLSLRRATQPARQTQTALCGFLSTLSLRRATVLWAFIETYMQNFYPRSPCGERPAEGGEQHKFLKFLSTLSLRRATLEICLPGCTGEISIHALLAESDKQAQGFKIPPLSISIHALLAESDANSRTERQGQHISIHALLAESD